MLITKASNEVHLFDLPVYRLSADAYEQEREAHLKQRMTPALPEQAELTRSFYERHPEREAAFRDHLIVTYGGEWEFNEIIGYIRVIASATEIRGEHWQVRAKRIVRTRRKLFEWQGYRLAVDADIPANASNTQILDAIHEYVAGCRKELRGRFVDTAILDTLGPHINWRAVIGGV